MCGVPRTCSPLVFSVCFYLFLFLMLLHLNCHCCKSLWWHLESSAPAWFQVPRGNNLAACAQHESVPGICQAQPALPYGSISYEQPQRRTKRVKRREMWRDLRGESAEWSLSLWNRKERDVGQFSGALVNGTVDKQPFWAAFSDAKLSYGLP